jgi:hypothetical protein
MGVVSAMQHVQETIARWFEWLRGCERQTRPFGRAEILSHMIIVAIIGGSQIERAPIWNGWPADLTGLLAPSRSGIVRL